MQLWPHQEFAIQRFAELRDQGAKTLVLTSPTGGGKTIVMGEMSRDYADHSKRVLLLTNRRILTSQSAGTMAKLGVGYGVMAAGYDRSVFQRVQIGSVQTIYSRCIKRNKWDLPPADLVLVDEAHANKAGMVQAILAKYRALGAVIVLVTATPVGLPKADGLIVAGKNSELRKCGALVPCYVYAPDEPSMKGVKKTLVGEYVQAEMRQRVMQTVVFGDVFAHWQRLNPLQRPTLLFAPGVAESRWFVDEFKKMGVAAAHIDGETDEDERQFAFERHKVGDLPVISSYGVLREGADLPWAYHGILLQPCAALSTYLQIVGRLLRAYDGKSSCILQDHAGCWHRHGSPNIDREWRLGATDKQIKEEREKRLDAGDEREPIRCPNCGGIRGAAGTKPSDICPHCGHKHIKSVRLVRMTDGTLVKKVGNVHKKKKPQHPDVQAWRSCLYAAMYAKRPMTVEQAAAWFYKRTGHSLPDGLLGMPPRGDIKRTYLVKDVFPWLRPRQKRAA